MLAAVLSLGLVVSGCSSSDDVDSTSSETSEDSLLPEAEGKTEYPLTLESLYGETTLEERPERIAIVGGSGEFEVALSLGVSPVIVPQDVDALDYFAPFTSQFDASVTVNPWSGYDIGTVAQQEPDLIVSPTLTDIEKEYPRLAEIAPVLAPGTTKVEGLAQAGAIDWEELTEDMGKALDLSEKAETVVSDTYASVEMLRSEHPEFSGKSVSILINRGAEYGIEVSNGADSATEVLLGDLGFDKLKNRDSLQGRAKISLENIGLVDADIIMVNQHGGGGDRQVAESWLESNKVYQNLPAVKAGRVVQIGQNAGTLSWALAYLNPVSIPYAAQKLSDLASEALEE